MILQYLYAQKIFTNFIPLIAGYKVYYCHTHPLHASLPDISHPVRSTRQATAANSVSFTSIRYNTNQYSRCFIPAATKLWNTLPSAVVESVDIQRFKVGANSFLINR